MTIKTERLLSRAKKLYTKGNFSEAESIYLEVLKLVPNNKDAKNCLLYTSPSPRDVEESRMPSSA